MTATARTRAAAPAGLDASSSRPSAWLTTRCVRAWRSICGATRSGIRPDVALPVASSVWPALPTTAISLADSCSRSRSSESGSADDALSPRRSAASRVLVARSLTMASIVPRPRLRPASSAPSTLTSNQLSIERDTNW